MEPGFPMIVFRDDIGYKGNVVSVGTFSKILGPGIRVGWMEAPERVLRAFDNWWVFWLIVRFSWAYQTSLLLYISLSGMAISGGAFNHMAAGLVAAILQQGSMASHLKELRTTYQVRLMVTLSSIIPRVDVWWPFLVHCISLVALQENYRAMARVLRENVPEIEMAELKVSKSLWWYAVLWK